MKGRGGFTLIEVVVSVLLTAVMVSAVFTVALSVKTGGGKADRKLLAGQAERALSATLKGYVTSDNTATNTVIAGPNACARTGCGTPGPTSWNIHTPGVQTDSLGDVYALTAAPVGSEHVLTCVAAPGADAACFVPKVLRDPPFNGTIKYSVVGSPPQVIVTVNWTEP